MSGAGRLWLRLAGITASVTVLAALWVLSPLADRVRAPLFDRMLAATTTPDPALRPMVVDIDRDALALVGPWPWSRDKLAGLIGRIADAEPAALAVDIFFAGPDRSSPAALLRRLREGGYLGTAYPLERPPPDGDAALAGALARLPSVLGALLDPSGAGPAPAHPPVLLRGAADVSALGLWTEAGLAAPPPALAAAGSVSLQSLAGDADGAIRRVPLLAQGSGWLGAGLSLETLRLAAGGPPILIDTDTARLRAGPHDVSLGPDAKLRLVPVPAALRAANRIPAAQLLLGNPSAAARLTGRVVLLGGTAPELGGVRPVAGGTLAASVDLHADALAQLRAGLHPIRPGWAAAAEIVGILFLAAAGTLAARRLAPARGLAAATALCLLWPLSALAAAAGPHLLLDPAAPAAAGLAAFALSALAVAADTRSRARHLRTAFEQHLAPAVVRRLAEQPDLLRLAGERRTVTALFTDIEGFSALTERAGPEDLVALLDGYFDGLTRIATDHGAMIDKIVGDAVHALFNVPVDLEDHGPRALTCARTMLAFAEAHRTGPLSARLGLGRTRIGLESGPAIVGNIGGARKLDYTAHGPAVNAAARYEQMNKTLGTDLLAGPGTATLLPAGTLMPLGPIAVRGMSTPQRLATLWPDDVAETHRDRCAELLAPTLLTTENVSELAGLGVPDRLLRSLPAARPA